MSARRIGDQWSVAIAFPTTVAERQLLAHAWGSGWEVVDIRSAEPEVSAIMLRPCSPQTLAALHRDYPRATLLVVEPGTASWLAISASLREFVLRGSERAAA